MSSSSITATPPVLLCLVDARQARLLRADRVATRHGDRVALAALGAWTSPAADGPRADRRKTTRDREARRREGAGRRHARLVWGWLRTRSDVRAGRLIIMAAPKLLGEFAALAGNDSPDTVELIACDLAPLRLDALQAHPAIPQALESAVCVGMAS